MDKIQDDGSRRPRQLFASSPLSPPYSFELYHHHPIRFPTTGHSLLKPTSIGHRHRTTLWPLQTSTYLFVSQVTAGSDRITICAFPLSCFYSKAQAYNYISPDPNPPRGRFPAPFAPSTASRISFDCLHPYPLSVSSLSQDRHHQLFLSRPLASVHLLLLFT